MQQWDKLYRGVLLITSDEKNTSYSDIEWLFFIGQLFYFNEWQFYSMQLWLLQYQEKNNLYQN